jgi:pimeloyl-ACP methyl ester carboxylesterase
MVGFKQSEERNIQCSVKYFKEWSMPEVMVKGTRIHYLESKAKKTNRTGPILLIHGSGGNAGIWQKVMDGLADGYPSLAVDLPGHGGSKGEGMKTIREYGEFVGDFLDALKLGTAVLGGHSMGGAIVQYFCLRYPEKLGAILLIGTGARLRVLPEALEMNRRMALGEIPPKFYPWGFAEKTSPAILAEGEREWAKTGAGVRYYDFLACDQFDLMEEIGKIHLPALIVCGKEDRLTPVKYSEFLNKRMAESRMEVIEGAGHMVMLERPRALSGAILRFLSSL